MKGTFLFPLILAVNACVPASQPGVVTRAAMEPSISSLPPMKSFGAHSPTTVPKSNNDLSLDFIELAFRMESGKDLSVLTRFEGPVSIRVTGAPPPTLRPDLSRLINRLRTEAGVDISPTDAPGANITVEAVSRSKIRNVLPQAACFVAPNVGSLDEYKRARRSPQTNWSLMTTRTRVAIFVPNDASPQEVRDCLHEEIAQALGPLNDLYRLPDSVFNDDNVHTVLTGFDMMILRAFYDPALKSGMSRGQVANALPGIFARINPGGTSTRPRFATRVNGTLRSKARWGRGAQMGNARTPPIAPSRLRKAWAGRITVAPLRITRWVVPSKAGTPKRHTSNTLWLTCFIRAIPVPICTARTLPPNLRHMLSPRPTGPKRCALSARTSKPHATAKTRLCSAHFYYCAPKRLNWKIALRKLNW